MVRTKKTLETSSLSKQAALLTRLKENSNNSIFSAAGIMDSWRYIDFINTKNKLPCLSLEWLFGSRGLLAGRILQLRATFSKGKSSFMYLQYAAAQIVSNAFCLHIETEGAPSPADYIASFGCNPEELLVAEIQSLEECLAKIDEIICEIRGGFGGGVGEGGRPTKTKFVDPIDPNKESPIVIGIDSLSSLGTEDSVNVDITDISNTPALSYHSRKIREFFRNRVGRLKETQTLLMLASHETAKIQTGIKRGFGSTGASDKSSLAQEAIGIHSTYGIDVRSSPYWDKATGNQLGDIITLFTFKNKISPRYREVSIPLIWNQGFDQTKADVDFLMNHPASPINVDGERNLYAHAHGITCKPLSDKSFRTPEEFLYALYENKDYLMSLREKMRIRGFGFDFESKYQHMDIDDDNDNEKEAKE